MAVLKTTSPCPTESAPSATPTNARPSSSTSAANFLCASSAWTVLLVPRAGADLADNDHRLIDPVLLLDQDLDALRIGRGHILADVIGSDGKLSVTAVDQHGKLDRSWAAEVHEGIHRGACCAATMNDVVHEDDDLSVDRGHVRRRSVLRLAEEAVVAVVAGVQGRDRQPRPLPLCQPG